MTKSAELFEEAKTFFPGGVSSPVRAFKSVKGTPLFIKKGNGSRIIDADDNEYIDYCCSWGPLILGHNNALVREKIIEAVGLGTSFGTPTPNELQLGKLIVENNQFVEKIRFVSSGTEAVMSAIRLARGFTKRDKILKFEGCYHGHVDSLLVKAGSGLVTFGETTSAGIPEAFAKETIVLPLNNPKLFIELMEKMGSQIACVIIEPVPANNGLLLQKASFLELLREQCTKHGALLIFDEVISGFRLGLEGAAGYYQIAPDIVTYGKIIGGGMPVGCYGASNEIMSCVSPDGPVYQAGTLSGNPVAMAAGIATLEQLLVPFFYKNLKQKTTYFVNKLTQYTQEKGYEVTFPHIASIFWVAFTSKTISDAEQIDPKSMEKFKIMHAELLKRGIYFGPSGYEVGFISDAHSYADLDETVEKMCKVFDIIFK
jgi:glutamate-1-semialdehyde 2,1-aminomutase